MVSSIAGDPPLILRPDSPPDRKLETGRGPTVVSTRECEAVVPGKKPHPPRKHPGVGRPQRGCSPQRRGAARGSSWPVRA